MSRKLVTIQKLEEIMPITGADFIDFARVKGWWVVVKKNEFKVGDEILYFEVDSFLPDLPQYEFLKKGSSLKRMLVDGEIKIGIRLKTIKLRGMISQGLIMPLSILPAGNYVVGQDVSDLLGVIKYEIPIDSSLSGIVKGFFPFFISKTDEERIQNMLDILDTDIKEFYITEKLDGSSVSYYKYKGMFGVCSRNLELSESEKNSQWLWARKNNIENLLEDGFAIQGEIVGEGINKNILKINGQQVYFFNIYDIINRRYLDFDEFIKKIECMGLQTVPIISKENDIPRNLNSLLRLAEGKSMINSKVEREGIVVRPMKEAKYNNERFSFKVISNSYLLKNEN